jgi:hypothetical protein
MHYESLALDPRKIKQGNETGAGFYPLNIGKGERKCVSMRA